VVAASPGIRASLQMGHPWVYRDQLVPIKGERGVPRLPSGAWVRVLCGPFEAVGMWDAQGAIAVRLFGGKNAPDDKGLAARVQAAWELRAPLRDAAAADPARATTAYRWIYGESDGLPGVVVDLYDRYAALALYSEGVATLQEPLIRALRGVAPLEGIVLRRHGAEAADASSGDGASGDATSGDGSPDRSRVATPGAVAWGATPPPELTVRENGLLFRANLLEGHKTGLYLDQRDNRAYLEPWCRGRRVLNAFSYTGAFSVYAAQGGAARVTSVDIAAAVVDEARNNMALNGHDPEAHEFVVADCFEWLEACARSGRRFDLVILDPPSLARGRSSRHAATRAYTRLNRLAMGCLEPGGLLATASCTGQVSPDMFREALAAAAAQANRRLTILHEAGHAMDHPVPAHFPEARYLKFVFGVVQPA
jgi:23S rRNA (cytosine1962-C5)-methyltransferase